MMGTRSFRYVTIAGLLAAVAVSAQQRQDSAAQPPQAGQGQTVTLMPDGRWLVLGGVGTETRANLWDPRTRSTSASIPLRQPRAWHSATLLPDGTVLVLGGRDRRGGTVATAERLDLAAAASEPLPSLNWRARFAHTATLVDGQEVMVAGGIVDGEPVGDVDLLDLEQWSVTTIGVLNPPRAYHSAALLADGRTVLWGGQGTEPGVETSGAIVDLAGPTVTDIFAPEQDDPLLSLAASDPADGAIDVSVSQRITLRFSRPARMETLSTATVTLAGPAGDLDVRVVPAEEGRLAFITPVDSLGPNTTYLVTVNGARDSRDAPFPLLSVTFSTTDAAPSPIESSDDKVWDPLSTGGQTWRGNRPESRWQQLPPLKARPGVTAVSGQLLRLNGSPLAGVRLEVGGRSAVTDATGRFLLINRTLTTGWHELWMDGRRARARGATYGTFEAAVWVTAGATAVLPYNIWMPAIDTARTVAIESPTTTETVVTTPLIPGLELRLPAGTVITDHEGQVVREVSITPVPVDQPPFPLPDGVNVPIYFTIQPGGAYVSVAGSGSYRRGARLVYPNYRNQPAGTPIDFWHYEPEEGRRWYVYGQGAVSADGRQLVPNPGVYLYEFTGAMAAPPSLGGGPGGKPGNPSKGADPVDLQTGLFVMDKTDLFLPDVSPVAINRTYRQNDTVVRSFGIGATHSFDIFLVGDTFPYTYLDLVLPDGGRVHYIRISPGIGFADAGYEHTSSPTGYFKSTIAWNGNGWNLDLKDGSRITFKEGFNAVRPSQSAAIQIQDRYGNRTILTRDAAADLTRITSPNGRSITLTYDTDHRVTEARDNINRVVQYTYDASGRLWKVTDPAGGVTEYTYDASHRMLTITDPRGIVYLTNAYDGNGRVIHQTQADSTTYQIAYTLDGGGNVTHADLTDPRGVVRRVTFAASGYVATDTSAFGTSLARTTTLTRDSNNQVTRVTDGLGRHTDSAYDGQGNVTSVTRLASTANAVTTSYTYEATFNLVTSVTDPLSHTTTFTRDGQGGVTSILDALSHETTFTYNAAGQPLTVTTAAGTTQFGYDGGDLVSVTDPVSGVTTRFLDGAGRVIWMTNPLGHTTRHEYSALNLLTKTIDALNGQTTFTYDANGNLLTLTDARNNVTTYTYNTMDRVATRTDPLARQESYVYDANGNLAQVTDRKGQGTAYSYDGLNRLGTVTYHDSSTTTHTYDAGDRLTQLVDSTAGTITRTWDLLDRLTSETTPEGSVSCSFDAADRRATMTVVGQPQVTYAYDNGNRLTGITQNSATVGFTYDSADRRTVLTLPNGVTGKYGYDAASQLTSLTYKLGATPLGNLTYTYDLSGNRTAVGGTWARTGLPTALASATYDAANQTATWASTSFAYDANGNLTSDGAKTYAWNARNQLTGLSGGVSASFQYDGTGRRRVKTVSGVSTAFLFDDLNIVQELTSGSPSADVVSALGLDEWLARTDAGGTRYLLGDALGSTLALTDGVGAVPTEYTYQPFGQSSVSGASPANSLQFTGRENDNTGLFYYRARYYDPQRQRFTAEDPLEFDAGDSNLYAYVSNAPTMYTDPTGTAQEPPNGPPIRLPPGHSWRPVPGTPRRPEKWVPTPRVPSPTGSQPQASWDPSKPPPHWDYDPGDGSPRRHIPPAPSVPGLPWRLPFPLPAVVNPCLIDPMICRPPVGRKTWS